MWPEWMIWLVSSLKAVFHVFRTNTLLGIPLDLVFRFVVIGGVYWFLRGRTTLQRTVLICLGMLLAKEAFDTFAVRSWRKVHWPEFLDFEDVLSGVLGMLAAEWGRRFLGIEPLQTPETSGLVDD